MMKTRPVLALVGVLSLILCGDAFAAGSGEAKAAPKPNPNAARYQQLADRLLQHLEAQKIPKHLTTPEATARQDADYDVMEIFKLLPHISMEKGWVLDWVYYFRGLGGQPMVYARPADKPRYADWPEYVEKTRGDDTPFHQHIVADGSEDGFFEYVLLINYVGRFYVYWHAGTADERLLFTPEKLKSILAGDGVMGDISADAKKEAAKLDPNPVVKVEGDKATVSVMGFSNFNGFRRIDYVIGKAFPHRFLSSDSKTLVKWKTEAVF